MFFALLLLISCELKEGDNPYKILGLPKSASKPEIKAAYKKLTEKYHPDLNKEEGSQQKWIEINEAYEILSDPDRKARFDKFGTISNDYNQENTDEKRYFTEESLVSVKKNLKEVTSENFDNFTQHVGDYIFLIYRSVLCDECDIYLAIFGYFQKTYNKLVRCGIIDMASEIELCKNFKAINIPTLVFYKKTTNETHFTISDSDIRGINDIENFWRDQYPANIEVLKTKQNLNSFINDDPTQVHVVQFVRTQRETVQFKRLASVLGQIFSFGVFIDTSFQQSRDFNITMFPEILVYRNPSLAPLHYNQMKQLTNVLLSLSSPILFHVDGFTFARHCKDVCFVRCEYPQSFQAQNLIDLNRSIGWIEKNSQFAKSLEMHEGDWVAVFPEIGVFARVPKRLDDKASLKYFWDDYSKKKINFEQIPESFGFPLTFDAFWTEFTRFMVYNIKRFQSGIFYIIISILILLVNFIISRRKKNKNNLNQRNKKLNDKMMKKKTN